jgi:Arc/MetJ-type ribon-helix-helix transcriptional regulator
MTLPLTPETEQRIAQHLATGQYQSADELILAGLHLLEQRQKRLNEIDWDDALVAMAADPQIQTELAAIDADFAPTELDGLTQ